MENDSTISKSSKVRQYPNPRLVKQYRNYLVSEVATTLGVHKNTVRNWVKIGLPIIGKKKPWLIHGGDLREFLTAKRKLRKRKSGKGEIYCFKCQAPRSPKKVVLEVREDPRVAGNVKGLCPVCGTTMNKRFAQTKLIAITEEFQVHHSTA